MKVVIDTNVFVSACIGNGASAQVIASCLRGCCQPIMGAALLTEYEDVLSRSKLFYKSRLSAIEREDLLNAFLSVCNWVKVYYLWRPNLPDESDNHLIELAVAGQADALVSKNLRDLQAAELSFPSLRLLSPHSFLNLINHGHTDDRNS